jgi:hypothetical protein
MMKKNNAQINGKKGGIAEEIEKLKQRREERKYKEDKKGQVQGGVNEGKTMDSDFEKMMKKKKQEIFQNEPENVKYIE